MVEYPDQYLNLFTPPPVAITYWGGDLLYLENEMEVTPANQKKWIENWINNGLRAYQKLYNEGPRGRFSHGDVPTIADACLIPQMANARRNECDLSGFIDLLAV